jgi:hypothetical protein
MWRQFGAFCRSTSLRKPSRFRRKQWLHAGERTRGLAHDGLAPTPLGRGGRVPPTRPADAQSNAVRRFVSSLHQAGASRPVRPCRTGRLDRQEPASLDVRPGPARQSLEVVGVHNARPLQVLAVSPAAALPGALPSALKREQTSHHRQAASRRLVAQPVPANSKARPHTNPT